MPSWYPGRPYKPVDAKDADKTEIPKSRELKSKLDEWLTGNVVEPMAKAGYPNVGAGIATVPSSIAEFLTPESPYELAPGMAGVRKMGRKAEKMSKDLLDYAEKNPGKIDLILDWLYNDSKGNLPDMFDKSDLKSRMASGKLSELLRFIKGKKENDLEHKLNTGNWPAKFETTRKELRQPVETLKGFKKLDPKEESSLTKSAKQIIDDINYNKNYESKRLDLAHKAVFGDKPYTAPKRLAAQEAARARKAAKPQAPMSKLPSRQDYDQMLQGKTDPNYYDRLREEFYNKEEELSPLERFLKGKGDQ